MAILNEEQTMLRDGAREWAQSASPVAALRRLRDQDGGGHDPDIWRQMGEMGWCGVIVPEAYGGSDFGCLGLGLILEETGRTLTASPLLSTAMIGASALALAGSAEQQAAHLPALAEGRLITALAVDEAAHHDPAATALQAVREGAGWRLKGTKTFVLEGMAADLFIVAARTSGAPGQTTGISLFLVPADAAGLSRTRLHMVDSRDYAALTFTDVEVGADALLGAQDQGFAVLDAVLDRARAGLAAEMIGAAAQAFETTLDYLKTRTQFGQTIGTFQALQHRAAKMYTDLELARSCVEAALEAVDNRANDTPALASLAKAKAGDVLHLVSNEMVQMHGGIGMTDAHDAGLYMKRARAAEATYGGSAFHRDRYARLNGY